MYCVKCGKELSEGERYCTNCGNAVHYNNTDKEQNAVVSMKRKREKLMTADFYIALLMGASISEMYYFIYYIVYKFFVSRSLEMEVSITNMYISALIIMTFVFVIFIVNERSDILTGLKTIQEPAQLRGVVGASIGAGSICLYILTSLGRSFNGEITSKRLFIEGIFWIALFVAALFVARKKNIRFKFDLSTPLFIVGAYDWLFWVFALLFGTREKFGILSVVANILPFLPYIIAIISVIMFFSCKRESE